MDAKEEKNTREFKNPKSIFRWLWNFFSSARLAITLIFILAGLSLLGALLIQVPSEVANDPQLYSSWVDTIAVNKVGFWAPLLSSLYMFDIFHSPWFIIAGTLLILNIFICSINRWSGIKLKLHGGLIKHKSSFYLSGDSHAELGDVTVPVSDASIISEKVLRKQGYRTRTENDEDQIYIVADKNRYCLLGTYFSHFSLVLFVLAFIAGSYLGFRDSNFTVPVGSTREIGHATDLSLQLTSFTDEYYDNGMPKDYRSQVNIYENGQLVEQGIIRVNHPLIYKGIRFYQAYFGPAVNVIVRDENQDILFNDIIPLDSAFSIEGYVHYGGSFNLAKEGLLIRLIGSDASPMIPAGQLAVDVRSGDEQIDLKLIELDVPRSVGGLEFTYIGESKYSGFQVSKDPTNIIIWIASALFIFGIGAVLFFPHRQAWILFQRSGRENGRLLIRTLAPRGYNGVFELKNLLAQIEKEIKGHKHG